MTPLVVDFTLFVLSLICCAGLFGLLVASMLEGRAGGGL